MQVCTFVVFCFVLLSQIQSKEYWPDFSVCGTVKPHRTQETHELCEDIVKHDVKEYADKGWGWTPNIFCFKACMLVRNYIVFTKETKNTGNITMLGPDEEDIGWSIGTNYNNYRLGPPLAENIWTLCRKEVDLINEKQLHCNEWNDFYNCVIKATSCCAEPCT